ncbi:ABC transporter substrate-binding protein [Dyadobacter sp. LJ53]|uniref:ABC transporter substrate-binding protein n=1 Tax=Dyadobacter chenwenxiniae TaxID=2906456 RepID=UPI001F41E658|nr:ABC transporter substrate-binding protein [Dyadobacter chenwenxiniae]MCF0050881.1 ABC transporter substrate-binding protein [Dyadobacter chenwenxiniae]
MKVIIVVIFILAGLSDAAFAQNIAQTESRYKSALADYKQGRYAAAMEKLSPLTSVNAKTTYSAYAHYYYALSAYQLKRYKESRQMLLQLQSRYPGWNRVGDAHYLLGAIALEAGQLDEGLGYLAKIKDSSLAKDIFSLKQHYFGAITDLAKLKELQKQYADDRDIALTLVHFIETSPSSTQTDFQVADQLQKQFKFSKKEKVAVAEEAPKRSVPKSEGQWTKGYYDVSVLLPFRLDEFSTAKRRSNQFAYDYYLGLTMAKEQLAAEGVNVNLWAYDVGADAKAVQPIVDNKNFQQSDMVIGPLYPATFEATAGYFANANAVMLNPLSTDGNLLKVGSNIYLAHPSIAFQMQKAAQWMKTQAMGTTSAIYYGNTPKDSAMAFSYAGEWTSKGGKVMEMVKIQPNREWLETNIPAFETSKPSHVALFSTDGSSGPMLMEVLNGRKLISTPVLSTATSFSAQQSRLNRYASRLYLIDTDYVDREKDSIREFQKNYWNKTNTFPSVYSYQGYDQLLFFARMLAKHKDRFQDGLRSARLGEEEYLLSGFNFTKSNENQITPVLKYNGSKWMPVDR